MVVVVVVVVVVLEMTFTHVSVHTRTIQLNEINLHAHDWWPDTWEKLPASAPPPEPSMTRNSSSSRAPPTAKTGAQLRDNPEERENCGKNAKKPFTAAITTTAKLRTQLWR